MTTPMTGEPGDVTANAACVHRWLLAMAADGGTPGRCRLCHSVRTFTDARRTRLGYGTSPGARSATPASWGR